MLKSARALEHCHILPAVLPVEDTVLQNLEVDNFIEIIGIISENNDDS